jgi:hypothetical protein
VPVSYLSGSTSLTANLDIIITFARTGDIGDTGFTGSVGYAGSRGDLGFTGSVGTTGFTGSIGSLGFAGSVGYTGSFGATGFTGSQGDTGFAGSVGFTGSKGDLGFTGSTGSGFVGSAGFLGSTGFVGSKGDLGFTGSIGFTGSAATSSFTNGQSISINNLISTGQMSVGNGVVNTAITNNSITTAFLNLTSNTGFSTFSTELSDVATAKTVSFGAVPLNSASANGYTVEFFVKFKTLPTSGLSEFGGTTVSQIGLQANTSAIQIVNKGFTGAGDTVYRTFENNVWYHFAYIGRNSNTYIAIDGQVTNLNDIGGYSGYSATGTWTGGWPKLSGNAVFSNFRVVTNQGGDVYDINGFTPPAAPLTAISNTKILTLIGNTFVDASGTNTTITTAGSPTLISDTVSISNMPGAITTTIDGTTLSVSNIYTTFLYANNAAGNTGQLLAANSTGGIFWTSVVGYAGSTGFTGSVGYVGSQGDLGYTGSIGFTGSIGYTGSKGDLGGVTYDVTNSGSGAYVILGNNNPDLTLARGLTYYFNINASGHPFWIKTDPVTGTGNAYSSGVTNNGVDNGIVTFTVPLDAPNTLYYICQYHGAMVGVFTIRNLGELGFTGSAGAVGFTGSGGTGFTGSTGAGFTGSQGDLGYTGSQGAGFTGSVGYVGSQGEQGNLGYTGSAGAGGEGGGYTGSQGDLGYTGSRGTDGIVGYNGSVGFTGSEGTGFTGSAGAGFVGSKGDSSTANATSQYFVSNGSNTTYNLSQAINNSNNALVIMDGLVQIPNIDYTIANTTLTLSQAAPQYSSIEIRNLENGAGVINNRSYLLSMVFNI